MVDRADVMLKDYEAMRAEVLQRLGARQTITTFFVPVTATLIGAGLSAEPLLTTVVLAFAVPFVCYQTIYLWMAETQSIRRIGVRHKSGGLGDIRAPLSSGARRPRRRGST